MEDIVFVWLGILAFAYLLLGPISIIVSVVTRGRLKEAEARIAALTQRLEGFERQAAPLPEETIQPLLEARPEPASPVSEPIPPPAEAQPEDVAPIAPAPVPPPVIQPRPKRSFEEAFGTRWVVWVGGVALALGALLLVRYSIEAGFFGPAARVVMGLLLAGALVFGGEKLRRRDQGQVVPSFVNIPAMLTAAGAISAFGSLYAAYDVYGFIGGPIAFILLALVAFGCLLAANRHGPALAALGLIGSMVTPLLVSSEDPSPFILTIYLAIVAAATFTLAHIRRWRWLALATAAAAGLWVLAFRELANAVAAGRLAFDAGCLHLVLQATMAALVFSILPYGAEARRTARYDADAIVVPALFALVTWWWLMLGGQFSQYGTGWILCAAFLLTITTAAGYVSKPARPLVGVAGAFTLALLFVWPAQVPITIIPDSWQETARLLAKPMTDPGSFIGFALIAALALAVTSTRRVRTDWRLDERDCALFAGTAALTPLGALVIAYLRLGSGRTDWLFAALAAGLAVLFVFAATRFREAFNEAGSDDRPRLEFGLGAAASGSFAALALALVLAIDGGMLTVSLALAALGCAFVCVRLQIPALRWCVAGFGVAVAVRLVWDPRIVGEALGQTPIFNWLLFGYGVPALAFAWAARMLRRAGDEDIPVRIAQSVAIVLSGFLVLFEIRHALYHGDIFAEQSGLVEQGLMTVSACAFSAVLARLDAAHGSIVFRIASYVFGILSLITTLLGLGLVENPWFSNEEVIGGPFFNTLLLGYAIPALAAFGLARTIQKIRPKPYVLAIRIATVLLTFAYLSLETRRLFHDGHIGLWHGSSDAEIYTYSAVWLGFGVLLLAYGLWRSSREVRLASAVFVTLSVLKVFLFDLAGLEGLLRAVSFIGLGLALIGIGLVYQKLVFRPRPASDSVPTTGDVL